MVCLVLVHVSLVLTYFPCAALLFALPLQICHLSQLGLPMVVDTSYDYWKDTFGVTDGRPRLGYAGGRKTPEMRIKDMPPLKPAERKRSDRQESFFEASSVNIGAAIDDQVSRLKREARKQQWEAMIAKRREEQERDRAALIEKERRKGAYIFLLAPSTTPLIFHTSLVPDFEDSLLAMRSEKKALQESYTPSADILAEGQGLDINVSATGIVDKLDALSLDK